MQLIRHLKDEELTDLLLENEEREMRELFSASPAALQAVTDQPVWFWQKQLAVIRERIAGKRRSWIRPMAAWASAMALALLAFSLLNRTSAPKQAVKYRCKPIQTSNCWARWNRRLGMRVRLRLSPPLCWPMKSAPHKRSAVHNDL